MKKTQPRDVPRPLIGCGLALIPSERCPRVPGAIPFSLLALLFLIFVIGGHDLNWFVVIAPLVASFATASSSV